MLIFLGQQAQPQASPANKSIYFYERSGSSSPQIPYQHNRDHLASDSLVLNTNAASKYINVMSGGNRNNFHASSSSLPVSNSVPPKVVNRSFNIQQQTANNDYIQVSAPMNFANQLQNASPSRSISRPYNHSSPTKSVGSIGSRPAMEEINGSDYVCMSGGTLTKKLQQVKSLPNQSVSYQQPQVIYQKPPPIPPLSNINLKTNYVTPANELPQAQYSTAANHSVDAIAVAKQSVNFNALSNSPTVSPTPSNVSAGSGKSKPSILWKHSRIVIFFFFFQF